MASWDLDNITSDNGLWLSCDKPLPKPEDSCASYQSVDMISRKLYFWKYSIISQSQQVNYILSHI